MVLPIHLLYIDQWKREHYILKSFLSDFCLIRMKRPLIIYNINAIATLARQNFLEYKNRSY